VTYLLIGVGGALGANVRYLVSTWAAGRFGTAFPYGTLIVNLAGSFLLGFFMGVVTVWLDADAETRIVVAVGVLGAETTFSTFAYETVALLRQGAYGAAVRNLLGSAILGILCAAAGLALADLVTGGAW